MGNDQDRKGRVAVDHNMLKGVSSFDDASFTRFFKEVVFPQFTLAENIFATSTAKGAKNTVCRLPEMRKDFKCAILRRRQQCTSAGPPECALRWST